MTVESILKVKGHRVETIGPDATVATAVHKLAAMGIGALVVSTDGAHPEGILAEREVVRGLAKHGVRLLDMAAGDVMARSVPVCSPRDSLRAVMAEMTRSRSRHLPVVDDGTLCGLISVGDVVKNRVEEMEMEATVLRDVAIRHR